MNLVTVIKNEPLTTTLIIADGMNLKHRAIMALVDKYKKRIETHGLLTFEMSKVGVKKMGRPLRFAWLNESQTVFLITLMRNSSEVVEFKDKLTKEFFRQRKILAHIATQLKNEQWQNERKLGKTARLAETNTIKEFTEYCKNQGSKNADRYYSNISKMENKSLFLLEQKYPNVRNVLSGYQLNIIASADIIVNKALKEGMQKEMNYKDIFKLAKENIEKFASIIGKSPVPMIDGKNLFEISQGVFNN